MEQLGKADLASTALRHIDAFNVARWVPYPAKSKRSGAVLGAPSADEVGPAKSRKGPNPKPLHRGCFGFFKENNHDEPVRAHNLVELHHKPISTSDH